MRVLLGDVFTYRPTEKWYIHRLGRKQKRKTLKEMHMHVTMPLNLNQHQMLIKYYIEYS